MPSETATLESRLARPEEDTEPLCALFEDVFSRRADPAVWRWKYAPHAGLAPSSIVYCLDGEIVGHIGIVSHRGRLAGRARPFHQMMDIMVRSDCRLRFGLTQTARDPVLAVASATKPEGVLFGVVDDRRAIFYRWLGGVVAKQPVAFHRFVPPAAPATSGVTVEAWSWDKAPLDTVWGEQSHLVPTGVVRDAAYLRWRYRDHPTHGTLLFGVVAGGAPVGWIVTQDLRGKPGTDADVNVLDMLLADGHRDAALSAVARSLAARSLRYWLTASSVPEHREDAPGAWFVVHQTGAGDESAPMHCTLGEADEWWW